MNCIHCGSDKLFKWQTKKNIVMCKDCRRTFSPNSNPNRGKIIDNKKWCNTCNQFKDLDDFGTQQYKGKINIRSQCKTCFNEKHSSRFRPYKINEELFNVLLHSQDNKCAICGNNFKSNRLTYIDHNHVNGKVRGLLCAKCNALLGTCNDNIDVLSNAISYLINNEGIVHGIIGNKVDIVP